MSSVGGQLVFQSVDPAGEWTLFKGEETITLNFPPGFQNPYDWQAFISTSATQDAGTFAPCAGQECELSNVTATSVQVTNASCADYYLYFIAYAKPLVGPAIDAGADAPHD